MLKRKGSKTRRSKMRKRVFRKVFEGLRGVKRARKKRGDGVRRREGRRGAWRGKGGKEDVNININVTLEPEKRRGVRGRGSRVEEGGRVKRDSGKEAEREFIVNNREEGRDSSVKSHEPGGRVLILKKEHEEENSVRSSGKETKSSDRGKEEKGGSEERERSSETRGRSSDTRERSSEERERSSETRGRSSETSGRSSEERGRSDSKDKQEKSSKKTINKQGTSDREPSLKEKKTHHRASTPYRKINDNEEDISCNSKKSIYSEMMKDKSHTTDLSIKDKQSELSNKVKKENPNISENKSPFFETLCSKTKENSSDKIKSESIVEDKEHKDKKCVSEKSSKINEIPLAETSDIGTSESHKDRNKEKNRKLCRKQSNCKSDNKSIFAEDCEFCSKEYNGKNKSNSVKRCEGLENENLFGTPKTKLRKK